MIAFIAFIAFGGGGPKMVVVLLVSLESHQKRFPQNKTLPLGMLSAFMRCFQEKRPKVYTEQSDQTPRPKSSLRGMALP